MCPVLGSPVEDRYGSVRAGPEEGRENDQRAETHLVWRRAERVGVVQTGEEKALGAFRYTTRSCQTDFFLKTCLQ